MRRGVTIKEIARAAGVSPMTVSRVLNRRPGVREETRRRVLRIVEELNYRPNLLARGLVTKRSGTIGVIITTIKNPFYLELAQAVEEEARVHGYNIILCCTGFDLGLEAEHIQELKRRGVDGIIITSAHTKDEEVARLMEEGFAVVLVNRRVLEPDLSGKVDFVGVDNRAGAKAAVRHLIEMGHWRIGIIRGGMESSVTLERLEGAREALEEVSLSWDEELVVGGDFLRDSGYEGAKRLMALDDPPSAIFCLNDYMALGAYDALLEMGLRVPEDVALVGFNDVEFSSLRMIGLTTVSQKTYFMGQTAVRLLGARIRGEGKVREVIFSPELVIRRSCGYHRRAKMRKEGVL